LQCFVTATTATNPIWGGCLCSDRGGVYVGKGGVSVARPYIKVERSVAMQVWAEVMLGISFFFSFTPTHL